LMTAACYGQAGAVRVLLDCGAEINAKSLNNQWTALMFATVPLEADACELLLERGADASICGKHGETAEMIARSKRRPQMVRLLQKHWGAQCHDLALKNQQQLKSKARPRILKSPAA